MDLPGGSCGLRTRVDTWGSPPLEKITRLFFEMSAYDIDIRIADEGRSPLAPLVHVHELTPASALGIARRIGGRVRRVRRRHRSVRVIEPLADGPTRVGSGAQTDPAPPAFPPEAQGPVIARVSVAVNV